MRRLEVFSVMLSLAWLCVSMSLPSRDGNTVFEAEACTSLRARRAELRAELDRLDREIAGCSPEVSAAVSRDGIPSFARATRRRQIIGKARRNAIPVRLFDTSTSVHVTVASSSFVPCVLCMGVVSPLVHKSSSYMRTAG